MPTPRRVPDDLWVEVEKLLPPLPPPEHGGHPRADDRLLLDAMLHILWTGSPWRAMPQEFGPWQTVYDRFAEWKRAGVFAQIWAACLHLYDDKHSIEWQWKAADVTYVRSHVGGKRERPQSD